VPASGSSALHGSSISSTSGPVTSAREAQALLLPAGECCRRALEAILHLVPQAHLAQHALAGLVASAAAAHPVLAQREIEIPADREREGVRSLEHHADTAAQRDHVEARVAWIGSPRGLSRSENLRS